MKADVVVIGGGAAGMMLAGTAASNMRRVVLLEPNEKLGRKLRITGKGRCNCTNNCTVKAFLENIPTNPKFLYSSLNAFSPDAAMSFFEEIGVPLKTERGNRVFPVSDSANEIADKLADWALGQNVQWLRESAEEIITDNGAVVAVRTKNTLISCDSAAICTGGKSYPLTGSKGAGYQLASRLGHNITAIKPSLVPLESPDAFCAQLSGFAPRNVIVRVYENDKQIFEELGEMLFAHFGVTGPLILSASSHMHNFETKQYRMTIDFKPALSEEKLDDRILRDFSKFSNRNFANSLNELAAKSFIPVLVEKSGIDPEQKVNSITRTQRKQLVSLLKSFPVCISGPRPVSDAIVTSGGVDVKEVNPRTMESRLISGLYFAGEVLDVDAYTGGFNLQIAWSTGRCAGNHV